MTWSIQLTPWALPSLLAVLLVLRDWDTLWPVRREPGALALMALALTAGLWAALHLAVVVTVPVDVRLTLVRATYAPAALAAVAWAWFAFSFAHRRRELFGGPMLLLLAATVVTLWLMVDPEGARYLVDDARPSDRGGVVGLVVTRGAWHWAHVSVRILAVVGATWVLGRHVSERGEGGLRLATVATAGLVAVVPSLVQELAAPGRLWTDPSPLGFALASTVLGFGVLRERLEGLGPVARSVVLEGLRDPVVVLDRRGRFVDVNRAAEEMLGFETYGDVPVSLGTLWAGARESGTVEVTRLSLPVRATFPETSGGAEEDGPGPPDLEGVRTFEVTVNPLTEPRSDGRVALVLRDVTEQDRMEREIRRAQAATALANEELERLASTDSLTGLANRRHFMDVLSTEIDRARRYERPLSVVLLDLDHFKKVNDRHGHAAGDAVLRSAGAALRSVCRDVDLAGRLGGEELALVLPETDSVGARVVAERVRSRIEGTAHRGPEGEDFSVTASIGVSWLEPGHVTGEALLQQADKALYRAKRGGRNQVILIS